MPPIIDNLLIRGGLATTLWPRSRGHRKAPVMRLRFKVFQCGEKWTVPED
jgi:hypothetical protein